MIKRGTDDLKQLAILQSGLVRPFFCALERPLNDPCLVSSTPQSTVGVYSPSMPFDAGAVSAPPIGPPEEDIARLPTLPRRVPKCAETERRAAADRRTGRQANCDRGRPRRRCCERVV